ncbi:MAG: hypothetical protein EOO77_36670, partial [Oxalobacteraceae bacterium]
MLYRILEEHQRGKYELPFVFFMLAPVQPTEPQLWEVERRINEAFEWCRDQFGAFPGGESGNAWNPDLGQATGIKDMRWFGQRGLFLFSNPVCATAFK